MNESIKIPNEKHNDETVKSYFCSMLNNQTEYILKQYPGGWAVCDKPFYWLGNIVERLYFSSSSKEFCIEILKKSCAKYIEKPMNNYPYN